MRYELARSMIRTGDLIAVRRRSGPFAIGTRLVTGSPYTHTGIAAWENGRLLMFHANGGGGNIIPLSQYSHTVFDVFDCPVQRSAALQACWDLLGSRVPYGYSDLARIAAHIWLGVDLPPENGDMVCSSLSAAIYKRAGWLPEGLPSIPWPGAVVAALSRPAKVEVRP